ncbi:MAG: ribosomal protein S18-alanine N-acetyltransferase [Nocardioidaceae bacterium]
MRVRAARPSDVAPVSALEAELFGRDSWSPALVEGELGHELRSCVVAVIDDAVVGYAILFVVGDTADLQRVGVDRRHQRAGIGRRLLSALALDSYPTVLLEVRADNAAAVALYESAGFQRIDRRPGYYADGGDALVMQRVPEPAT